MVWVSYWGFILYCGSMSRKAIQMFWVPSISGVGLGFILGFHIVLRLHEPQSYSNVLGTRHIRCWFCGSLSCMRTGTLSFNLDCRWFAGALQFQICAGLCLVTKRFEAWLLLPSWLRSPRWLMVCQRPRCTLTFQSHRRRLLSLRRVTLGHMMLSPQTLS